ncbi:MAG: hypothetical protein ACI4K8_01475, partial [Candidatus Fimenecus sp.]
EGLTFEVPKRTLQFEHFFPQFFLTLLPHFPFVQFLGCNKPKDFPKKESLFSFCLDDVEFFCITSVGTTYVSFRKLHQICGGENSPNLGTERRGQATRPTP